jgi:hypothetical protein
MQLQDWHHGGELAFAGLLQGEASEPLLLLLFNPADALQAFALPPGTWRLALDSSGELAEHGEHRSTLAAPACSLLVLSQVPEAPAS